MSSHRSLLKVLVTVAALAALLIPAAVALGLGWIRIQSPEAFPRRDQTPIEVWAALAVFYVFWVALVLAGLISALDRLGYKYTPLDAPEDTRRERRRRGALMTYLRARQQPPSRRPAKRPVKKPRPPDDRKAA